MIKELKSILKNKLVIFIIFSLITGYFVSVYNLKASSISREENLLWNMESMGKDISKWKSFTYKRATLQDNTKDKHLSNNYISTQEMIREKNNDIIRKLKNNEKVEFDEIISLDILRSLIYTEHFTGLYGKEYLSPMRAFPKKIEKFLEDIDFKYNIHDINFLKKNEETVPYRDYIAYRIKSLESEIDNYYTKKEYPGIFEYSIFNFTRNINYGGKDTWSYWIENLSIATLPLLAFYIIDEHKKYGTIKNIYLRSNKKYKNFIYFFGSLLIVSIIVVYLPIIISSIYVLFTGEYYDANTNLIVFKKGLSSFKDSYESNWLSIEGISGLSNLRYGAVGDLLDYGDLMEISFIKFLSYFMTIDILKIVLIVLVATSCSLLIKNKKISFGINLLITLMIFFAGKTNSMLFISKLNPFSLPNGWRITLGREHISYFNSLVLLIIWIVVILVISLIIGNERELE